MTGGCHPRTALAVGCKHSVKAGQVDSGSVTFDRMPNDTVQFKHHMSAIGCGFNRSMQHLVSIRREEDVAGIHLKLGYIRETDIKPSAAMTSATTRFSQRRLLPMVLHPYLGQFRLHLSHDGLEFGITAQAFQERIPSDISENSHAAVHPGM
jgi:hypothetical protein